MAKTKDYKAAYFHLRNSIAETISNLRRGEQHAEYFASLLKDSEIWLESALDEADGKYLERPQAEPK